LLHSLANSSNSTGFTNDWSLECFHGYGCQ